MATSSSYFLNAPSLGSATAIFTDDGLTTCAVDGFYSDGVITREQVDCVLLPQQICPDCTGESYNCISGTCIDPEDGTGTYPTLEACQAACSFIPEEYVIDNSATGTALEACNGITTTSTVYALPGYNVPIVTMIFYDNPSLTTPFVGSVGWRKLTKNGINYAAEVNVDGELTNYVVCAPVSYNCVEGTCVDPGDGTGTFESLIACEADCAVAESYNCVEGICSDPGDGSGTYSTLVACESACTPVEYTIDNSAAGTSSEACNGSTTTSTVYAEPGYTVPIVTMIFYDSPSLTSPFIGSVGWRKLTRGAINYAAEVGVDGELTNYVTCPDVSYNCVSGTCVDPGDGTGTFATLIACEADCAVAESYNCISGVCTDPGDGSGTYSTLAACEGACTPVEYTVDSFATGSSGTACSTGTPSVTTYAAPVYGVPMVEMIFYTDIALTSPFVGSSTGWRKFTNGITNYAGEIDTTGELTNYTTC